MTDKNSETATLCRRIYYKSCELSGEDSLEARFALEWLIESCLAAGLTDEAGELKDKLPETKMKSLLMGDEPVTILRAYASACLDCGNFDLGKFFLQRAVIICSRPYGPRKIVVTETIAEFGEFLLHFKKTDEGLALLEKASAMARKIEGESYRASMITFNLARGYLKVGKVDKASITFSEFVNFIKPQFPAKDRRLVNIYLEIGLAYEDQGLWKESLNYYQLAYKALKKSTGVLHSEVVPVLNGMALSISHLGDIPRAEKIFRKALSIVVKVHGTSIHPSALPVLKNLEIIYEKLNMNDKLLLIRSRISRIDELD